MKTFKPEDCVFVDEVTGIEYISTPELDVMSYLGIMVFIGVTSTVWIGFILSLFN